MAKPCQLWVTLALLAVVCIGKPVTFTPLDKDVTDPSSFWMPLYNEIPQDYCENPRYPIVPTFGGIAMDIIHELWPNGTVPKAPAKPTNIWQKNLWAFKWDNFDYWGAIYPYPYIASPKTGVVLLMYPGAPVGDFGNRAMTEGFASPGEVTPGHPAIHNASYPYITMAASFDLGLQIVNGVNPKLHNVTDMGAVVDYQDAKNKSVAKVYFLKGSPFVNIECTGCILSFGWDTLPPVVGVNGLAPGNDVSGKHFRLHTAAGPAHPQGRDWHAFFEHDTDLAIANPPITPVIVNGGKPYTGLLQVACGEIDDKEAGFLTKAAGTYARQATTHYDIEGNQGKMIFEFEKVGNGTLTMLAIPHQMRLMDKSTVTQKTSYWCIKGNMTAVHADSWELAYNLTTVGFGDTLTVDAKMKDKVLEAAMLDYNLRIRACPGDNDTTGYPGYMNMELYAYARDLAQYSDIAIILENLGKRAEAVNMSKKVLECIRPILKRPDNAPRPCPPPINGSAICVRDQQDVYYDTHWGGLVTNWYNRFAAHYCQCDKPGGVDACKGYNYCDNPRGWSAFSNYGNPFYNDHHFQYGYIVKSLSWLIYFQTVKKADLGMNATTLHNVTKQALAFAREFANPDPVKDHYFTYLRHKDTYDGHSWAEGYDYSGRILNWVNQQSGGEAINSYYSVYLLGLALNDDNILNWGRIQLASESFSIQQYQHLSNRTEDKKGQPTKEVNKWGKCLPILMGNGASGATYYGPNAIFQCSITLLPVTPFTAEWVDAGWAEEALDWIMWQKNATGVCVFFDPLTMKENPCPGPYEPSNWTGNMWGCCPTNVGYPDNQWRSYPEWFPYMYILQSAKKPEEAWKNLQYADIHKPTTAQPFPYIASDGRIVGYQADITMASAFFHVATVGNRHKQP